MNDYLPGQVFSVEQFHQLVAPTGQRLLGYGVDDQYRIQSTQLVPLTIPLGSQAVAQAASTVVMEGTLTPNGDIANTAEVIKAAFLETQPSAADSSSVGLGVLRVQPLRSRYCT